MASYFPQAFPRRTSLLPDLWTRLDARDLWTPQVGSPRDETRTHHDRATQRHHGSETQRITRRNSTRSLGSGVMDWAANLDAAAFGALVAAASGVLVPRIIERVPEPEPEEPDEADQRGRVGGRAGADGQAPRFEGASQPDEGPKETYFAIADRPGLLWKCVLGGPGQRRPDRPGGRLGLVAAVPAAAGAGLAGPDRHRLAYPAAADLADRPHVRRPGRARRSWPRWPPRTGTT